MLTFRDSHNRTWTTPAAPDPATLERLAKQLRLSNTIAGRCDGLDALAASWRGPWALVEPDARDHGLSEADFIAALAHPADLNAALAAFRGFVAGLTHEQRAAVEMTSGALRAVPRSGGNLHL